MPTSSRSNQKFDNLAHVNVHVSQFPDNVRRDLLESLRVRQINHKFHYDSVKQAQRWLELHHAYSPFVTDPQCATIYDSAFQTIAGTLPDPHLHVIGLGCGGGQKDVRLLQALAQAGKKLFYTPADVSSAMVLIARQAALEIVQAKNCFPLVCDLATAGNLPDVLAEHSSSDAPRLITFFGMLPNFEPESILPSLSQLLRPGESFLFSANLAPGPDYTEGVQRVLPLYDNRLTREWLLTFLLDLGIARDDGKIRFVLEDDLENRGLKRIVARFVFERNCAFQIESESFRFHTGDSLRLFFSYRHTSPLLHQLFEKFGLRIIQEWITPSEEEGIFVATTQVPP